MQIGGEARYADLFAQFAASDGRQTDLVFKVDELYARASVGCHQLIMRRKRGLYGATRRRAADSVRGLAQLDR